MLYDLIDLINRKLTIKIHLLEYLMNENDKIVDKIKMIVIPTVIVSRLAIETEEYI